MADKEQKTLAPTDKRLEDARRKGDLPVAPEMRHALMFLAALVGLGAIGLAMLRGLAALAVTLWSEAGSQPLTAQAATRAATAVVGEALAAIGPLLLVTLAMAALAIFAQGIPTVSWSRLAPQWTRLSPLAGFKRLLGGAAWVEFSKTIAKVVFVGAVMGFIAWPDFAGLDRFVGADAQSIGAHAAVVVAAMVRSAALMVGALALADLVWQHRAWFAKMRMSLQEVKDEQKESDGNPQIKARIRAIAMQRAQRRMMAAVPKASVIITNPTHYAVALHYDHGAMRAPVVVAKGVDAIALKIREVASEARVPIVESPPLARALYAAVEIDRPITPEHYAAVAEIISYVLRLTGPKAQRAT